MALTEGTDRVVFVGDTTANENAGDIAGLHHAGRRGRAGPSTRPAKSRRPETLTAFAELVDGKHSATALRTCGLWRPSGRTPYGW